jgi:hypothetical protein
MTVAWGLLSTARINRAVIEALHRAAATGSTALELEPVPSTTGSVR